MAKERAKQNESLQQQQKQQQHQAIIAAHKQRQMQQQKAVLDAQQRILKNALTQSQNSSSYNNSGIDVVSYQTK